MIFNYAANDFRELLEIHLVIIWSLDNPKNARILSQCASEVPPNNTDTKDSHPSNRRLIPNGATKHIISPMSNFNILGGLFRVEKSLFFSKMRKPPKNKNLANFCT